MLYTQLVWALMILLAHNYEMSLPNCLPEQLGNRGIVVYDQPEGFSGI